ncbi:GTPase IMAP family member 7-like [Leuresthes tenuis]|uniref:GTPase IMAP family member 7-like n=1 Tax=Leuresthes tenuis TaxID=355514 RepID=UPI003B51175D
MAADLRIVLLGKTGAGKSSFAEAIFGEEVFEMDDSANSGTSECQSATREVNGRNITVIDTPGFFDNIRNEEDLKAEIAKCITECSPGPHAFLILLKVEKFTKHEKEIVSEIKETFSEEALKFAVVVFTHGDQLRKGMKIEEFVRGNEHLQDLLEKCGGRCHVVDNKYWKNNQQDEYRNNQIQVGNLLNTITEMVNNRGFYTNEMLQIVNGLIQEEERRSQSSSGHMSQEDRKSQAKKTVSNNLKKAAGVTTGMWFRSLLGVPVMVGTVTLVLKAMRPAMGGVAAGLAGAAAVSTVGVGTVAGAAAVAIAAAAVGYFRSRKTDEADSGSSGSEEHS